MSLLGNKIKDIREFRNLTQKELGLAVGFSESTADVRIAQYESGKRTPKRELMEKIAEVLDVNIFYFLPDGEPDLLTFMTQLFYLDELYKDTLQIFTYETGSGVEYKGIKFNNTLMREFLSAWENIRKELAEGRITKDEYKEWKINWPDTMDKDKNGEPKKKWRSSDKDK